MGIDAHEAMAVFSPRDGVDTVWPGTGVIYSQRLSARRTESRLNRIVGDACLPLDDDPQLADHAGVARPHAQACLISLALCVGVETHAVPSAASTDQRWNGVQCDVRVRSRQTGRKPCRRRGYQEQRVDVQVGGDLVWSVLYISDADVAGVWLQPVATPVIEAAGAGLMAMYSRRAAAYRSRPVTSDRRGGLPGDLFEP